MNPFSTPVIRKDTQTPTTAVSIPDHRSILFVIADSVRALDIVQNPGIAPNIVRIGGGSDSLSLAQHSASNCTHFSMFSMLTGQLPTAFGQARRRAQPTGLTPLLQANGYRVSSAEALSLDWYDISTLLLAGAERHVADSGTAEVRDDFVTDTSIDLIRSNGNKPFFHIAYYNGAHFPYGDREPLQGLTGGTAASYREAITALDQEVGRLLTALEPQINKDNILVIVTSDHGENLLENGHIGHASSLNDAQTVVPFAVLNGGTAALPRSQLGIYDYIMGQLGVAAPPGDTNPIIVSNCSYEVPNGFAVLGQDWRADFLYEDGFLSPVTSPNGDLPPKAIQLRAAKYLVEAIREN